MNEHSFYDLLVIGGGTAGTTAALRAAGHGARTALMESGFLGGVCLNTGCIPTKFLLGGTAFRPLLEAQNELGTVSGAAHSDLAALQARKDEYVTGRRLALENQLQEAGVSVIRGQAVFSGPNQALLKARGQTHRLDFAKCVVATGSAPAVFPGLKPDGAGVLGPASMLALRQAPEHLLIIGGGAIGLEFGELFHRLGSRITLVEVAPRILPGEDEDISRAVHDFHHRRGWRIHTGRRIASVGSMDGQAELVFEDGGRITASRALIAVGRRSNAAALAPEKAGMALDERGWLRTDEALRCAETIYAVGDINGRVLLAHAAAHQARYAADHALGLQGGPYGHPPMTSCLYGSMEVMRAGPTLHELAAAGAEELTQSRAPFSGNVISQSHGQAEGFARLVWGGNRLLAASAAGPGASHLVSAAALLVGREIEEKNGLPLLFAHPTLDEVLESAMLASKEKVR